MEKGWMTIEIREDDSFPGWLSVKVSEDIFGKVVIPTSINGKDNLTSIETESGKQLAECLLDAFCHSPDFTRIGITSSREFIVSFREIIPRNSKEKLVEAFKRVFHKENSRRTAKERIILA